MPRDIDRVLVSCIQAFDAMPRYQPEFDNHGIEVELLAPKGQHLGEEDLIPIVNRYAGAIIGDDIFSHRVIQQASRLRVLSKWGIGVDAIDHDAAYKRGIKVYNTPGVFGEDLADYALGYLILLARRQHEVDRRVRQGTWHKPRGSSLQGKTLGIVGLGSSGWALARRAAAIGMRVLGTDITVPAQTSLEVVGYEFVDLRQLLERSHVVSLHVPLTSETYHMIDNSAVARMREGAWLINVSRGPLVSDEALISALDSGIIGAAALDVYETEPLPDDHPLVYYDNVILGSHNGSNTHEAVERATDQAVRNLMMGLGRYSE